MASLGVLAEVLASLLGQLLISRNVRLDVLFKLSTLFTATSLLVAWLLPTSSRASLTKPLLSTAASSLTSIPAGSVASVVEPSAEADVSSQPTICTSGTEQYASCAAREELSADGSSYSFTPGRASYGQGGRSRIGDVADCTARARVLCTDTIHLLRHSGAMYYYMWLAFATAVHHLVVTYWQAAVPTGHAPIPSTHHHPNLTLLDSATPDDEMPFPSPRSSTIAMLAAGAELVDSTRAVFDTTHGDGPPANRDASATNVTRGCRPDGGVDGGSSSHLCKHPGKINGYTQATASLLGGLAALLPMVGERTLRSERCGQLREILLVWGPLLLAALLYSMSVAQRCAQPNATADPLSWLRSLPTR